MTAKLNPGLEPKVIEAVQRARPDNEDLTANEMTAVAICSAAVSFKRLVDLLEPTLKMVAGQAAKEAAESSKGKRP